MVELVQIVVRVASRVADAVAFVGGGVESESWTDGTVGQIFLLRDWIDEGQHGPGTAIVTGSAGLLALALVLGTVTELYKSVRGDTPDYWRHIVRVAFFSLLLGSYHLATNVLIGTVESFGTFNGAVTRAEKTFKQRFVRFQGYVADESSRDHWWENLTQSAMFNTLMRFVTIETYWWTLMVIALLRYVQQFMVAIAVKFGPIMIGFASLGGPMDGLLIGWMWAVVEVTAWGVTMNVLLRVIPASPPGTAEGVPSLGQDMMLNVMYSLAILAVPVITSWLIRSAPAAGLVTSSVGRAAAFMAMVKTAGVMAATGGARMAAGAARGGRSGIARVVSGVASRMRKGD